MKQPKLFPDLQAALACEDVRLEVNGFNSLVGVIHVIAVPTVPFRILKLCIFTRWVNGIGAFSQTARILTPEEETELAKSETHFELSSTDVQATNVAFFGGLEFTQFGDYPIEIIIDGDLRMRFPLKVVQLQALPQG